MIIRGQNLKIKYVKNKKEFTISFLNNKKTEKEIKLSFSKMKSLVKLLYSNITILDNLFREQKKLKGLEYLVEKYYNG